jgi:hypothetical protein
MVLEVKLRSCAHWHLYTIPDRLGSDELKTLMSHSNAFARETIECFLHGQIVTFTHDL